MEVVRVVVRDRDGAFSAFPPFSASSESREGTGTVPGRARPTRAPGTAAVEP